MPESVEVKLDRLETKDVPLGGLTISVNEINSDYGNITLTVGATGRQSKRQRLEIGDAFTFESGLGIYEIRVLKVRYPSTLRVTQLGPPPAGGS